MINMSKNTRLTRFANGTSAFQHSALVSTTHGFFTSEGGVSTGAYTSLNAGLGSHDDPSLVKENRALAAQSLQLPSEHLCGLFQYHSAEIISYTNRPANDARPRADGLVTNHPDCALVILTADCAPIFLVDKGAGVIGACHAGWRGAVSGVIQNTVSAMSELGATRDQISMVIGPTIAPMSYQVGTEMRDAALLESHVTGISNCFTQDRNAPDKWHFDLPAFCILAGESAGLTDIDNIGVDTYSQTDLCFSHRRATHQKVLDTGRLLSIISLKPSEM